ncbi:MAG TPA: hypothetical protein VGO25_11810 [Rhodanobacteraceae bacterium]|nr:hypothetical protein [Rhodanobacteraceae bacterium]
MQTQRAPEDGRVALGACDLIVSSSLEPTKNFRLLFLIGAVIYIAFFIRSRRSVRSYWTALDVGFFRLPARLSRHASVLVIV